MGTASKSLRELRIEIAKHCVDGGPCHLAFGSYFSRVYFLHFKRA